jgi:hypothetical protein
MDKEYWNAVGGAWLTVFKEGVTGLGWAVALMVTLIYLVSTSDPAPQSDPAVGVKCVQPRGAD